MARLSKTEIEAHRSGRATAGQPDTKRDTSGQEPDSGRSAEREAQDRVIDHTSRRESWLTHIWRVVTQSTGRPSSRP